MYKINIKYSNEENRGTVVTPTSSLQQLQKTRKCFKSKNISKITDSEYIQHTYKPR